MMKKKYISLIIFNMLYVSKWVTDVTSVCVCVWTRQGGHHELAERLVEIQYELTDRLAFYLCGRKPGEREKLHSEIYQC